LRAIDGVGLSGRIEGPPEVKAALIGAPSCCGESAAGPTRANKRPADASDSEVKPDVRLAALDTFVQLLTPAMGRLNGGWHARDCKTSAACGTSRSTGQHRILDKSHAGTKMNIQSEDWPVISALFDEALDLPAEDRRHWLDGLAEPRRVFRGVLERLLADHARAETLDFLEALPQVGVVEERADSPRQIGPYRLLSELGRGGMGSVWLAERSDGLPRRRVALKLPHPGLATHAFAERLARERDILSALEHPHIARLYDAGVSREGQPYIALAYVQGAR